MNKTTIIAVLSALIIGIIMGSQIRCNGGKGKFETVSVKHDTVISYIPRTDTVLKTVASYVPVPYKVTDYRFVDSGHVASTPTSKVTDSLPLEVSYYSDSLRRANEFKAVITDTVLGRILGRSVQWADLSPTEVKTVTNTVTLVKKQALVKVFLGIDLSARINAPLQPDIAPAAAFVISDRYMLDVNYGIFNERPQLGFLVKLSFRK